MNNIQFWIYLIVVVITLIARARNKKQPTRTSSPEQSSGQPGQEETNKPMTFEDLLREIQASKTETTKPVSVPQVLDYDDEIEEAPRSLERTKYQYVQSERTTEIYEKAKAEAFNRPSLEETMKLQDTIIRFGQFKGYQHDEKISPAAKFAREIRDPSGFRKAFIMSEILKRRF